MLAFLSTDIQKVFLVGNSKSDFFTIFREKIYFLFIFFPFIQCWKKLAFCDQWQFLTKHGRF